MARKAWRSCVLVAVVVGSGTETGPAVAAPWGPPGDVRTYEFTARVTANGGVTPFKVGATVRGTATYDRRAVDLQPDQQECGRYASPRNALAFRVGDLEFRAAGDVAATTGAFAHAEHVQVVSSDLVLPAGWSMDHRRGSQTYGVLLQNAPPLETMVGKGLPDLVKLTDFKSTRELRLDFFHGVAFPGGQVKGRATVFAILESFDLVRPGAGRAAEPVAAPDRAGKK